MRSTINLFGLLKDYDHDYDKLYDTLLSHSTAELTAELRKHKLPKSDTPCEALVLHTYNTAQSWGERKFADSYTREGGFEFDKPKRKKGNASKFEPTKPMPGRFDDVDISMDMSRLIKPNREVLEAELNELSTNELKERCKKNNIQYRKREDAVEQILFKEYDFEHGHKAIRGEYAGGTNSPGRTRELAKAKAEYEEAQALRAQVLAEQEVRFEAERQERIRTTPAKVTTDKDFYIRSYQVDWDYIDIDMSHVDLREAARLYKLALENEIGMPVPVPVLIEYHEGTDLGHRWRVVGKHTYAYVAVKLAKKWGSREDTTVWGKHEPCEACGMVQCTVLNTCSVGSGLGKEQPSQAYLDAVLAMLD